MAPSQSRHRRNRRAGARQCAAVRGANRPGCRRTRKRTRRARDDARRNTKRDANTPRCATKPNGDGDGDDDDDEWEIQSAAARALTAFKLSARRGANAE